MVFSSHRFRWGYACLRCGSNPNTGKRFFIVNAPGGSPFSAEEYSTLKKEVEERNSQRDELFLKIKELTENNKRYKERLDSTQQQQQQLHVLGKTLSTQVADRDHLIGSLQNIIEEHENKILRLEQEVHGNILAREGPASSPKSSAHSPTPVSVAAFSSGSGATARLISDIKRLQDEKASLASQLNEAKIQEVMCKTEQWETISSLQKSLAAKERENDILKAQLRLADKENINQTMSDGTGSCSTDTEKQLEKVQVENARLVKEVSSLHRFYSRTSSVGFTDHVEQLKNAEEENERLAGRLAAAESSLEQKRGAWSELETQLRSEIKTLQHERQQTARQLRDLQAKWTSLRARDPDVVTHIDHVYMEVESKEARSQLQEAKAKVSSLEEQLLSWKQKVSTRDHRISDLQSQLDNLSEKLRKSVEEKQLLQECLMEEVEKERQSKELAVQDTQRKMEKKMFELQASNQQIRLRLVHLHSSFESVKQAFALLQRQARHFHAMLAGVVKVVQDEVLKLVQKVGEENKDLVRKYHKEMHLRKRYHNELVELKGNIRVFCRVRPPIKEDGTGTQADIVVTYDPDDDGVIYVSSKGRIQTFDFDRVFSDASTQIQVFNEVSALVTSCIDGFNVCIFAYGQTGSGKTFTMEGPADDPGINQRALQELFQEAEERGQDWHFNICVSVLEIYNETIRDLLSTDSGNKLEVKMKPEGGGYYVPGLQTVEVHTLHDVNQVFSVGKKNRATATTNMNEHSSRSHCLLCVTITGLNRTTNTRTFGRLNLVDLAGSERVSKSGADGTRLKEAQNINKSLACLGDVIHALRIKQSHIPFRNSKLTYLLQDSLGGDSKTLMIVQVAPVEKNVSETVCSLSFGQRVRNVELGAATRKMEAADAELCQDKSPLSPMPSTPPPKRSAPSPKQSPISRSTPNKPSPASLRSTPRLTRQQLRK